MRARNAKKRHFQVETLEERLALDGTTTFSATVTNTTSTPVIGLVSQGNGNSSMSYTVSNESSASLTVQSPPLATATITPLKPVSYGATVPTVPPVLVSPVLVSPVLVSPVLVSPVVVPPVVVLPPPGLGVFPGR